MTGIGVLFVSEGVRDEIVRKHKKISWDKIKVDVPPKYYKIDEYKWLPNKDCTTVRDNKGKLIGKVCWKVRKEFIGEWVEGEFEHEGEVEDATPVDVKFTRIKKG